MFDFGKLTNVFKSIQDLTKGLPLDKIFTGDFMAANTKFKSITDFLSKAGIDPGSLAGIIESKDSKLNDFVSKNTKFKDWKDMFSTAASLLTKK